jgi:hypothetical protein
MLDTDQKRVVVATAEQLIFWTVNFKFFMTPSLIFDRLSVEKVTNP